MTAATAFVGRLAAACAVAIAALLPAAQPAPDTQKAAERPTLIKPKIARPAPPLSDGRWLSTVYHDNRFFRSGFYRPQGNPTKVTEWFEYSDCQTTPLGAFRITVYEQPANPSGYDYSDFPSGLARQYTKTFVDRKPSDSLTFSWPLRGGKSYHTVVEVPGRLGCVQWKTDAGGD